MMYRKEENCENIINVKMDQCGVNFKYVVDMHVSFLSACGNRG